MPRGKTPPSVEPTLLDRISLAFVLKKPHPRRRGAKRGRWEATNTRLQMTIRGHRYQLLLSKLYHTYHIYALVFAQMSMSSACASKPHIHAYLYLNARTRLLALSVKSFRWKTPAARTDRPSRPSHLAESVRAARSPPLGSRLDIGYPAALGNRRLSLISLDSADPRRDETHCSGTRLLYRYRRYLSPPCFFRQIQGPPPQGLRAGGGHCPPRWRPPFPRCTPVTSAGVVDFESFPAKVSRKVATAISSPIRPSNSVPRDRSGMSGSRAVSSAARPAGV